MDTSRQLALTDVTGWERGLYEDLMATFRAPIVNWIIRTLTANEPDFMRYLWGQVKPIFDTRGFATVAVTYRDTILSGIAGDSDLSPIDRTSLDLAPETYRDLQGQVATFDIVAPRLAVLFAVLDRGLSGESLGSAFPADADRAVTAPYPDGFDNGRGRPPRLLDPDEVPSELEEVLAAVADRHGLDGGIPSIHRCLAQWPTFFIRSWRVIEPVLDSTAYREARADARSVVDDFVSTMPYQPQLDPRTLRSTGWSQSTVADIQDTVEAFLAGPATSVVPTLPMFAAMADMTGPRTV